MLTPQRCAAGYLWACEMELQAFKPGNVSVYSAGHDMTVADFRQSAQVSAPALCDPAYTLGEKIYAAVKATRETVACNTNLGIVLLCAPLLQAAQQRQPGQSLRAALAAVLDATTVADADQVFRAITLASPGGLGKADSHDVGERAGVDLRAAMAAAADRDLIARQYANCFKDVFDFALLHYNGVFVLSGDCVRATLTVYCEMLARYPDSHIERKYGQQYSDWIAAEMALLASAMRSADGFDELLPMLYRVDEAFKNRNINPGTTADMTVATLLAGFLEQELLTGDNVPVC